MIKNPLLEKKRNWKILQNLLDIYGLEFLSYNRSVDILLHLLTEFKVKTTMFLMELHRERGKALTKIQDETAEVLF